MEHYDHEYAEKVGRRLAEIARENASHSEPMLFTTQEMIAWLREEAKDTEVGYVTDPAKLLDIADRLEQLQKDSDELRQWKVVIDYGG